MTGASSSLAGLARASLAHHATRHVSVALGTAIATAVLVGALLVGDSVRGSLRARALWNASGPSTRPSSPGTGAFGTPSRTWWSRAPPTGPSPVDAPHR